MTNRTILITGASGKFGQILTKHFLAAGDIVIGTTRSDSSFNQLRTACGELSKNLHGILVDFTHEGSVGKLIEQLQQRGLKPDCLINNARSLEFLKVSDNGTVSRSDFCGEFLVDVVIPYELTMGLVDQPDSSLKKVVNIGSQYGLVAATPGLYTDPVRQSPIHYGVAKAALHHMTKELAVRLASRGVQVNCVAFGGVEGRVDNEFKNRYAKLCPIGRMLKESEVVGPIDMLLSQGSSAIVGQTIVADGGWSLW